MLSGSEATGAEHYTAHATVSGGNFTFLQEIIVPSNTIAP